MSIKQQIIDEMVVKKSVKASRKDKMSYKKLALAIKMSPSGLNRWIKDNDSRGIGSDKLEAIAKELGKKFILVDEKL